MAIRIAAQIRQVRAGGFVLRDVHPLVHCRYTFPSCLSDPDHLAVLARHGFVRAAFTLTPSRRSGCPQLQPARCDGLNAVSFHHRTVGERLVALDVGEPQPVRLIPVEVSIHQISRRWRVMHLLARTHASFDGSGQG